MKGVVPTMLHYAFAIVVGLIAIVVADRAIAGVGSPDVQALDFATRIALGINSLSAVESGRMELESGNVFDLAVEQRGDGYYVVVNVQGQGGEKRQEAFILGYTGGQGLERTLSAVKRICIVKAPEKAVAEVVRC